MEKYLKAFEFYEKCAERIYQRIGEEWEGIRKYTREEAYDVYYWAISGILEVACHDDALSLEEYAALCKKMNEWGKFNEAEQ